MEQENLGAVFASVADSEYEIRWQEGKNAYMAPNRAQNLRFQFRDNGFLAAPRDLKLARHDWSLDLTVESYGRNRELAQPHASEWVIDGKRAQVRLGDFTIIYANGKAGLRQDFSIATRPAGSGNLVVNLSLRATGAEARLAADASGVEFLAGGDVVGLYNELHVYDANRRELPARFTQSAESRFGVEVDDAGATYPILIDPSLITDGNITNPTTGSGFGYSIAYFTDAYSPTHNGVLVGAPFFDSGSATDAGKAFFYMISGGSVPSSPYWTYTGTQTNEHVGWSVACLGFVSSPLPQYVYSTIAIGAWGYSSGGYTQNGAIHIFRPQNSSTLGYDSTPNQTLTVASSYSGVGWSICAAGDVDANGHNDLLASAYAYSSGGYSYNGRALLFLGTSSGLSASAAWSYDGGGDSYTLGRALAVGDVNGDTYPDAIVGIPGSANGNVMVFHGNGSTFASSPDTTLTGDSSYSEFGKAVASGYDQNNDGYQDVIVGAPSGSTNGKGKAFLYRGSSSGLNTTATWSDVGGQNYEAFGTSVAFSKVRSVGAYDIVVGSPYYDYPLGPLTDSGKATIFWTGTTSPFTPAVAGSIDFGFGANWNVGISLTFGASLANGNANLVVGALGNATTVQNVRFWKEGP